MNHKTPEAEAQEVLLARVAAAGIMLKLAGTALSAFPYKIEEREGVEREVMLQMFTDLLGGMVPRIVSALKAAVMCLGADQSSGDQPGEEDLRGPMALVVDAVLWLLAELVEQPQLSVCNTAGERVRG
jgi:hypothetical protein